MTKYRGTTLKNDQGFILIMTLVLLVLLTLLGIWALQTSTVEYKVTGNAQETEKAFTTSEGGNLMEATRVNFTMRDWYALPDTSKYNQIIKPSTMAQFAPGALAALAGEHAPNIQDNDADKPENWPLDNLEDDQSSSRNPACDYHYLVTYLRKDTPQLGYGGEQAAHLTAYKFRIQANAAASPAIVETGGDRIGIDAGME